MMYRTSEKLLYLSFFLLIIIQPVCSDRNIINISSVDIELLDGYADIHVNYEVDEPERVIMLFFGENEAKEDLLYSLNFSEVTISQMNYTDAYLKTYDVNKIYGEGLYWFPSHTFGITIPDLNICSKQGCNSFENVSSLDDGIVYY